MGRIKTRYIKVVGHKIYEMGQNDFTENTTTNDIEPHVSEQDTASYDLILGYFRQKHDAISFSYVIAKGPYTVLFAHDQSFYIPFIQVVSLAHAETLAVEIFATYGISCVILEKKLIPDEQITV